MYQNALDLFEKAAREHPERVDDWIGIRDLAISYGDWLRTQGRSPEAEALNRRALAWFERPEVDLHWFDKVEEHRGRGVLLLCRPPRSLREAAGGHPPPEARTAPSHL